MSVDVHQIIPGNGSGPPARGQPAPALRNAVRALVDRPLPGVGGGSTRLRWRGLYEWARTSSVSVARLAEAHVDATSILTEAGLAPDRDEESDEDLRIYGVWASGPSSTAVLAHDGSAVSGVKPFCSGVGIVDRALVAVDDPRRDGPCLVEIDTSTLGRPEPWATTALSDTWTSSVELDNCRLVRLVGVDDWYVQRVGFWHGAIGPAACWAGAAAGLVDFAMLSTASSDDPFDLAARGRLAAQRATLEMALDRAGDEADCAPEDGVAAHRRALITRSIIERTAADIADTFSTMVGPRPFVADAALAQRFIDLHLYLRQHHGPDDLAQLGRLVER